MSNSMSMRANVGEWTRPERRVHAVLSALRVPHRCHVKGLPGTPDFLVGKKAVFVHGCFWHSCPAHRKPPKTNSAFWARKFHNNKARDERATRELRRAGYSVRVLWEHDLSVKTIMRAVA